MKPLKLFVLAITVSAPLFADSAMQPKTGRWSTHEEKKFQSSPKRHETGNILSMESFRDVDEDVVRLKIGTPKGDILVRVAPRWFIPNDSFHLVPGQPISVVGFEFTFEGKKELVAREIVNADKKLVVRESSGKPRWEERKDLDIKALKILVKNCAGCHNQENHPGAKFLREADFSDSETAALVRKMISESKMPPEHAKFKDTADGKFILQWLKRREADEPKSVK